MTEPDSFSDQQQPTDPAEETPRPAHRPDTDASPTVAAAVNAGVDGTVDADSGERPGGTESIDTGSDGTGSIGMGSDGTESGAAGPSETASRGQTPGGERTPGGGRMLGIAAVAGLGAVAGAGLLSGHPGTTHSAGHPHAGHVPPAHPAPAAWSAGDQGHTSGSDPQSGIAQPDAMTGHQSQGDGSLAGLQPAVDGSGGIVHHPAGPGTVAPTAAPDGWGMAAQPMGPDGSSLATQPAAPDGWGMAAQPTGPDGSSLVVQQPPAADGSGSAVPPAATDASAPTSAPTAAYGSGTAPQSSTVDGSPALYPTTADNADTVLQPAAMDGSAPAAHDLSATPTLYDSAGHPVMANDGAGHWQPITSASGTSPATTSPTPVLYDSSGHPVAMMDGSGHVVPISATAGQQASVDTAFSQQNQQNVIPPAPTSNLVAQDAAPQSQNSGQTTETVEMVEVYPTNAEIAESMRNMSPTEREKSIQDALTFNHLNLPNGMNVPQLPTDFFDRDEYTHTYADTTGTHTQKLDALSAAVAIAMAGGDIRTVDASNAVIADYMRDMSPAERDNLIKNVLVNSKVKLPNGQDAPTLPADFFNKDEYTYTYDDGTGPHSQQLDVLSAVVIVSMLEEKNAHLKVDIAALNSTATRLRMKANDIQTPAAALAVAFSNLGGVWDQAFAEAGDNADPTVINVRDNVEKIRELLLGGTMEKPSGLIDYVYNAVEAQAGKLEESANAYLVMEQKLLHQFNVDSDDYLQIPGAPNQKNPPDPYYSTKK